MAEDSDDSEKTEEPTQKRLDDAHEKGDVPKSQEVSTWFAVLGTAMAMTFLADRTAGSLSGLLENFFDKAGQMRLDGPALVLLWRDLGPALLAIIAAPMAVMLLFAMAGNLIQHKPIWSSERLKPKLEKVSPLKGLKRLFSQESLANFLKGLVKILVVAGLMGLVLWPQRRVLDTLVFRDLRLLLEETKELSLQLIGAILAVMTVIAGVDYLWQRQKWFKKQRMTRREIKEEYKQAEGDPQIKAKIRELRVMRSRHRMMSAVPEATVVIANPTHYAVALHYEEGMGAPKCVAKGVDALALRIRRVAEDAQVPVVENPPLARTLHAAMDLDELVPEEHFEAVAKVIGYVMQLKNKGGQRP
ncbi:flagellar biosynthesis protein FlhB [Polycladidibacter hongkongensis]|uniref:flagellar biosynthesis protein FlhB n=1 Tax=Polycladidibacter hongkongensis TaxID=1647556 RepID=UPI0008373B49|nr:flagellar biosynthesis protein FlhB [Pseudovibrio hongkongensis]